MVLISNLQLQNLVKFKIYVSNCLLGLAQPSPLFPCPFLPLSQPKPSVPPRTCIGRVQSTPPTPPPPLPPAIAACHRHRHRAPSALCILSPLCHPCAWTPSPGSPLLRVCSFNPRPPAPLHRAVSGLQSTFKVANGSLPFPGYKKLPHLTLALPHLASLSHQVQNQKRARVPFPTATPPSRFLHSGEHLPTHPASSRVPIPRNIFPKVIAPLVHRRRQIFVSSLSPAKTFLTAILCSPLSSLSAPVSSPCPSLACALFF